VIEQAGDSRQHMIGRVALIQGFCLRIWRNSYVAKITPCPEI
jgi:hypothetical protein